MSATKYQKFKGRTGFIAEISLVLVLLFIVLIVYLFPRFDSEPREQQEQTIEFIQSEESRRLSFSRWKPRNSDRRSPS
ncbi:MAG: hypothetical protein U5N26_01270 [Candidatus Marinimicrobia bacterium]|nr:hypothetical protein [Candidatus Neomarinimicrobiota bacterium]